MMHRRAFTLLEIMLASIIGAMVLLTCIEVFGAIQRTEQRSRDRFETLMELSTTQRAVEKAMRSLIMGESPPPRPSGLPGEPPRPNTPRPGDGPEIPLLNPDLPRLILSPVEQPAALMGYKDETGNVHTMPPQRLEVVLVDAPIFPAAELAPQDEPAIQPVRRRTNRPDHRHPNDRRSHQPMGRDLQAIAGTEGVVNGDPAVNIDPLLDQEMAPRSPGIRGVFELTWEVPEARRNHLVSTMADELPASAEEARGSWTLWWRALPNLPPPPPPPGSPESARPIQETDVPPPPPPPIKLASGLRTCKWEAVRSGDKFSRLSATAWDDLPAYMSLEIETQTGQWNQWMFEVTGTKGGEPGSPIQSPAGPRNGGGPGQAQPAQPDTPGAAPLITPGRPVKSTGPSGSASKTTGGAKQ